jgi:putative transposase
MDFTPHNLYHVYNQGNNKEILFRDKNDYLIFLQEISNLILPHSEIVAYCLMPDHFHLMIYMDERIGLLVKQGGLILDPLTNGFRKLLSGYARIANKKYHRTGSLFRQKTKSKLLTGADGLTPALESGVIDNCTNCFHYLHQNPWKAGLVERLEDWEFSSFRDYAGLRDGSICNEEIAHSLCNYDLNTFMQVSYGEIGMDFE